MDEDDELLAQVMQALEIDHQYVKHFEAWNEDGIARLRRIGRKAGRELGWKVRTFQTDPERRDDRRVVVIVAVIQSTAEDDARLEERSRVLLDEVFKQMKP